MSEPIGEYSCPNCGTVQIEDPSKVTLKYPLGLDSPEAKILCTCDVIIVSYISWDEAKLFELQGAAVEGFSLVTANELSDEEITDFMDNFESEMREFLNACYG